jgi:uncharacterized cupredoxin-like copper-binding protein
MKNERPSAARTVAVAGLIAQVFLTLILLHRARGFSIWLADLARGAGDAIGGAAALVLLIALIAPAWRGRRWALWLAVLLQVGLTLGIVPYLVASFAHPIAFNAWLLNITYFIAGVTAALFSVIAALEAGSRARPRAWRSAQGAALGAFAAVWLGMVVVGAAVASAPLPAGYLDTPADAVTTLRMEAMSFEPSELPLRAGRRTAVVVVNESAETHSFDVDTLGIHLRVPGHSTAMTLVQPTSDAPIPFYCGMPGHREAGMTGTLVIR